MQHLESLNDAVEELTGFAQRETVPDAFVASAEHIDFLDVEPKVLRRRIAEGAVFAHGESATALTGFFSGEHLTALTGLAIGWLQRRDPVEAAAARRALRAAPPLDRVVAALTGEAEGEHVIRRAAQLTAASGAELVGVHVRSPSARVGGPPSWLERQQRLLLEHGGRYAEVAAVDVATAVLGFVRSEPAHQLVLGATRRSRRDELWRGSVINQAIGSAGEIEVQVIPARHPRKQVEPTRIGQSPPPRRVRLPVGRRALAWALAVLTPAVLAFALLPLRSSLGIAGELSCMLLAVVVVAVTAGLRPAVLATVSGFLLAEFLYAPPYYSLRVSHVADVVALVLFAVVAVVVGGLVDILTRQVQIARARAEASGLARPLAEQLASDSRRSPRPPASWGESSTSTPSRCCVALRTVVGRASTRLERRSRSLPRRLSSQSSLPTGASSRSPAVGLARRKPSCCKRCWRPCVGSASATRAWTCGRERSER